VKTLTADVARRWTVAATILPYPWLIVTKWSIVTIIWPTFWIFGITPASLSGWSFEAVMDDGSYWHVDHKLLLKWTGSHGCFFTSVVLFFKLHGIAHMYIVINVIVMCHWLCVQWSLSLVVSLRQWTVVGTQTVSSVKCVIPLLLMLASSRVLAGTCTVWLYLAVSSPWIASVWSLSTLTTLQWMLDISVQITQSSAMCSSHLWWYDYHSDCIAFLQLISTLFNDNNNNTFLVERCNCIASSAIAIRCRLSVTRVYCDKTAEARIMQFSLKCSPVP